MKAIFDTKLLAHITHEQEVIDFEKIYKVKGDKVHPNEIQVYLTFGIKDGVIYLLEEEIETGNDFQFMGGCM